MELLSKLDSSGLLDKMKELGMLYSHMLEALELIKVEKKEERSLSVDEKIDILQHIVNHADAIEKTHSKNGVIDYYGALGEYVDEYLYGPEG